jgi:dipeptidase E
MKLFLASQDFGDHADKLRELVGNNKKALVVFNARDYKEGDGGEQFQRELLAENGFNFYRLDLRDYFGKEAGLNKFVADYKPGLVVLLGGNTFLLRRALAQSGFDKIIRRDVRQGKYVFAGHSAGSIVAGPDLHGYEHMDKEKLTFPPFQKEIIWDGLGLTNVRVIPHADSPKYEKEIIKQRKELFDKFNYEYVVLERYRRVDN